MHTAPPESTEAGICSRSTGQEAKNLQRLCILARRIKRRSGLGGPRISLLVNILLSIFVTHGVITCSKDVTMRYQDVGATCVPA